MRTKGKVNLSCDRSTLSVGQNASARIFAPNIAIREANAQHFVSCWNAFEPDGLVSKLVGALEKIADRTEDMDAPFRAMESPQMQDVARKALALVKEARPK